jgi:D-sedoheptulose 7-phosphate isomerase
MQAQSMYLEQERDNLETNYYANSLDENLVCMESLRSLSGQLKNAADKCITALEQRGKVLICGNGGSAAEAQHLAGELVGRYKLDRSPLAAIALAADPAVLTCIGNDYCFEEVFSRQVRALGRTGDLLIAFTTSGQSANILNALKAAREMGIDSISFLGRDGGAALKVTDCALVVDHRDTARIQEGHLFLMHCLVDLIEAGLKNKP